MQHQVSLPRLDERLTPGQRFLLGLLVIFGHALFLPFFVSAEGSPILPLIISPFAFILPPLIVARSMGVAVRASLAIHPVLPSQIGWCLLAGAGLVPAMGVLGALNAQWIEPSTEALEFMESMMPHGPAEWVGIVLAVGILTPLGEELLFRGLLQDAARPALGAAPAAVVVGLIFAAVHFQPWYLLPLSIVGMTLGLVRMITGSVLACAAVHAAYNIGMLAMGQFEASADADGAVSATLIMVLAAIGLVVTWQALGRLRPVATSLNADPPTRPYDQA